MPIDVKLTILGAQGKYYTKSETDVPFALQFFQPKKISDSYFPMLPDEMRCLAVPIVAGGCGVRGEHAITKYSPSSEFLRFQFVNSA